MLEKAASIDDLRRLAKRRLPRFAFDFIDGGAETERNLARNREAFETIVLKPRMLINVSSIETTVSLFGQDYGVPFGMAPVGFLDMAWPGSDLAMARLAAEKRFPLSVSTAASTTLEEIAEAAQGFVWFQMYVSRDETFVDDLLARAKAAGYRLLMITVDTVMPGKRDRDIRNRLKMPFRPTPGIAWDLLRHPRWSLATLAAGAPRFANALPDRNPTAGFRNLVELQKKMISPSFTWEDLKRLRDKWQAPLLLKGILNPEDAAKAMDLGLEGVVVSNHGGRQIDYGPAAIEALPGVAQAVAGRGEVLLDSGIRRGADVLRAKALGASYVMTGRCFAYGAAAGAAAGCRQAYDILETELTRAMGQLGRPTFAEIGGEILA